MFTNNRSVPSADLMIAVSVIATKAPTGFPNQKAAEVIERLAKNFNGKSQVTTEEIAGWFCSRTVGVGQLNPDEPTVASAASNGFSYESIGGDLDGTHVRTTEDNGFCNPDEGSIDFFDLNLVQEEGVVYRISCNRTLWLFKRLGHSNQWNVFVAPDWNRGENGWWRVLFEDEVVPCYVPPTRYEKQVISYNSEGGQSLGDLLKVAGIEIE